MAHLTELPRPARWVRALLDPDIDFARNKLLHAMIAIFVLFWAAMAIAPVDRLQWLVESLLPIGCVLALAFTYRSFRFTNLSYLLILLFLCLHTYASHYTYAGTPLDEWLKAVLHTKRSYYDRIVHFAFGLLWLLPAREFFVRAAGLSGFLSWAVPATVLFAGSAAFELIEAAAAMIAGPGAGEKFVGTQGDPFDAHKDMALGLLGTVIASAIFAWLKPDVDEQPARRTLLPRS